MLLHTTPPAQMARFDTTEDAVQRLGDSVVFIFHNNNRIPVRLQQHRGMDFEPRPLDQKDKGLPNLVNANSPIIEFISPSLGYINKNGGGEVSILYATRAPIRRFQQGLSRNNVHFCTPAGRYEPGWPCTDLQFAKMLRGDYPTQRDVAKAIPNDAVNAMAFHRKLAVVKHRRAEDTYELHYMNEPCGFVEIVDGNLEVYRLPSFQRFSHLLSLLSVCGVNVQM